MSSDRYPLPDKTSQTGNAWLGSVEAGLRTIETCYSGTVDPSTGHSWGADQVGLVWKKTTNPYSPQWNEWAKTGPGGGDYGWRVLAFRKIRRLVTAATVATVSPSPASGDVAAEPLDLAALLDTVQDSGQTYSLVSEAILRVRVMAGVDEDLGADDGYVELRANGGDTAVARVYAPRDGGKGGRWEEKEITVPLDADEIAEFRVKVGSGTVAFEWAIDLVGFQEPTA